MTLGEVVRKSLEAKGLSGRDAAEALGVRHPNEARMAREGYDPRLSSALGTLDALGYELRLVRKDNGKDMCALASPYDLGDVFGE